MRTKEQHRMRKSRGPRSDGRAVIDATVAIYGYAAVAIAHQRGLFRLLERERLTAEEISDRLELQPRPVNAVLAAVTSLGLLDLSDGRYSLTCLAEDYLAESSPTSYGPLLDLFIASNTLSVAPIDESVSTGAPQSPATDFASFEEKAERARFFTRAMHSVSHAPALTWPELVDLTEARMLLDIAGGSGAHAIGACLRWPQLTAVVLDLPAVCDVADEFIMRHGLEKRITTERADMWNDPFPAADLHLYSNILHDWPPGKGYTLIEKSFRTLPPDGRILIHEALLDDDKTGPFTVACYSMVMLTLAEGQQYTGRELIEMLTAAGFHDIEITPTFDYYSIVSGKKKTGRPR
jgi:hypothetical protein